MRLLWGSIQKENFIWSRFVSWNLHVDLDSLHATSNALSFKANSPDNNLGNAFLHGVHRENYYGPIAIQQNPRDINQFLDMAVHKLVNKLVR
jgi:hypothetical protein